MSSDSAAAPPASSERRTWLIATSVAGGVGVVAGAAPFVASFEPSERAKAAGAPIQVDLSAIAPGEMLVREWRGKPVWILHRTPQMIEEVKKANGSVADPDSKRTLYPTPAYARNELRSIKPQYFVAIGICTHLGCSPVGPLAAGANSQMGQYAGFLCPCHGSTFDLAGRVFKNMPAPDNLEVPPYRYLSETVVVVGDDASA